MSFRTSDNGLQLVRSAEGLRLEAYRDAVGVCLFRRLPQIVASPKGCNDALAAPRGEAKSTMVSQLFVLWCIVRGIKRYPVIIMDSIDQAYPKKINVFGVVRCRSISHSNQLILNVLLVRFCPVLFDTALLKVG